MEEQFERFLFNECKYNYEQVLMAVSGGADSMVLMHLFVQAGIKPLVAHCNFQLRGEESDGDETFVHQQSGSLGLDYISKSFDTEKYSKDNGISIQMAARALRYAWFNELLENMENGLIAVGSHFDDQIETSLINFGRGTGISGVRAMKPNNNRIIRPLLWATKKEILEYVSKKGISFRVDSSNAKTDYLRNAIRHDVIKPWENHVPNLKKGFAKSVAYLAQAEQLVMAYCDRWVTEHESASGETRSYSFDALKGDPHATLILFFLLDSKGFNGSQMEDMLRIDDDGEPRNFHSDSWTVTIQRSELKLNPKAKKDGVYLELNQQHIRMDSPRKIVSSVVEAKNGASVDPMVLTADLAKLNFPLILRNWKAGDRIQPLGMTGTKTVADILTDQKINARDKSDTLVLESEGSIIWIAGSTVSELVKLTDDTTEIYRLELG